MVHWNRFISTGGAARVISTIGGLYVVIAVSRIILLRGADKSLVDVMTTSLLIGLPGAVLLYSGYRLPDTNLRSDVYPRIVGRCLTGIGILLGSVGLLAISTGLNRPFFTPIAGTALGSVAGFGVGLNEARALSRAHEAEQRNRELIRYETLIEEATDVNAIVDPDGIFQYLTPSVDHVLGYASDELVGEEVFKYIHPDDREKVMNAFADTIKDRRGQPIEFRFEHKDGSWVVLAGSARNLLDDPIIEGIVAYTYDVTERKQLEENLRRERDLRERIFEMSPIGIMVLNQDREVTFLNNRGKQLIGRTQDEINERPSESPLLEIIDEQEELLSEEEMPFHRIVASGEPIFDVDFRLVRPDGERLWISVNGMPLVAQTGEVERVVLTFEDITERKRHQDQLVLINELSQELTDAETKQAVSDLAVEAARETLLLPMIAIALYDEEDGQLRYTAQTSAVTELVGDDSLFESERNLPWQVFINQTPTVSTDVLDQTDVSESETPLRSVIIFPLGEHGVFISGATTMNTFAETDVSLAQMVVANTRSALDRVDREQTLRERKNTLAEQNRALERVQRINEIIRKITQELIQSSTRDEIVQAVCDRFAAADVYRFAWIGIPDPVTDEVTPEAWAGVEDGYLETITVTVDESPTGQGPVGRAVRTHEPQVQNNIPADPPFDPWRQAALDRGYQSCIFVPLVYQNTLYGILNLYAGQPNIFNQMEEAVLTELGETIGYALNALERKQALVSEQSVELEFRLQKGKPPLFRFAAEHNCEFEFENIVQRADGSPGIFFTIRGVPSDEVLAFGKSSPDIEELILVSDRDGEALFECRLRDSAFLLSLLDRGAMPQTVTATGDEGYAVIRVPRSSNIRGFVELFNAQYEAVELVGRREVDEPIKTQHEFEAEFRTRLTERQEDILHTAYASGFFDWPRETTAQELADMLGVSQPTVSRHIRAGEQTLFGLMFDEE